ncbi:hypothetical protein [Iodobacter fluviatilis]|uniref:Uncharacterized protein n=1 Tax=Iodobacter fluviatilis TaxID=537 RepID=A0A377SVR3_9NEIS|nr:hypothetical protein [Iodobacter fluviatilis]TCU87909.1 hypothetical protein EV682_10476 [Iodobacter fluviatilis]STR45410.1 Uncharacterised protein [Iodobacter fluviatilis]
MSEQPFCPKKEVKSQTFPDELTPSIQGAIFASETRFPHQNGLNPDKTSPTIKQFHAEEDVNIHVFTLLSVQHFYGIVVEAWQNMGQFAYLFFIALDLASWP